MGQPGCLKEQVSCLGPEAAVAEELEETGLLQHGIPARAAWAKLEAASKSDVPPVYLRVAQDFLPERATGGEAAREFARYVGRTTSQTARAGKAPVPQYWDARIDHFPEPGAVVSTFRQKYFVDTMYYHRGGPVFLKLGGEGKVSGPPGGFIEQLAQDRRALLVQVEHRFYGDSIPRGNGSSSNLRLLTVEQALADFAGFIDWYTQSQALPGDTKWFVFGGSYSGALASWFRIAYPKKTVGALSSSGVVNAIFDFPLFDVHVARAIGPACAKANRAVTAAFEAYVLKEGPEEAWAKGLLGCRQDMSDGDFFYMLADALAMMVQFGKKSTMCHNLTGIDFKTAGPKAVMQNAAKLIRWYWGEDFGSSCFYDTACLADPSKYVVGGTDRSWRWQKCYQLAYLQPAPLPTQLEDDEPLPAPLRSRLVNMSYMVDQCYAIFGDNYAGPRGNIQWGTEAINAKFGGAQPKATKVFYSNFADDPWMEASVMPPRDIDAEQPYEAAYCKKDCGHCMDLQMAQDDDPPELKAVRARFTKYLDQWLGL